MGLERKQSGYIPFSLPLELCSSADCPSPVLMTLLSWVTLSPPCRARYSSALLRAFPAAATDPPLRSLTRSPGGRVGSVLTNCIPCCKGGLNFSHRFHQFWPGN